MTSRIGKSTPGVPSSHYGTGSDDINDNSESITLNKDENIQQNIQNSCQNNSSILESCNERGITPKTDNGTSDNATDDIKNQMKSTHTHTHPHRHIHAHRHKPAARLPLHDDQDYPCFSLLFRGMNVGLTDDRCTAVGYKGWLTVLSTHGDCKGKWFFEVKIAAKQPIPPHKNNPNANPEAHVRVGWSCRYTPYELPIGVSAYGFSLRDASGELLQEAKRHTVPTLGGNEPLIFKEGDVVGCLLELPPPSHPLPIGEDLSLSMFTNCGLVCDPQRMPIPHPSEGSYLRFHVNGRWSDRVMKDRVPEGSYHPGVSLFMGGAATFNPNGPFEYPPPPSLEDGWQPAGQMIKPPPPPLVREHIRVARASGMYSDKMVIGPPPYAHGAPSPVYDRDLLLNASERQMVAYDNTQTTGGGATGSAVSTCRRTTDSVHLSTKRRQIKVQQRKKKNPNNNSNKNIGVITDTHTHTNTDTHTHTHTDTGACDGSGEGGGASEVSLVLGPSGTCLYACDDVCDNINDTYNNNNNTDIKTFRDLRIGYTAGIDIRTPGYCDNNSYKRHRVG
eukprot:GHVR01073956.1.p1 GENE.GHVR01073956.1~~GHVR01073956.1.p1  ORF type:complete len:560 (+),score=184.97 GHVR01073956.1:34-1713(+)